MVRRAAHATLTRPELWPIALAGFLVRGGIVVAGLAVIPFPSAVGLANLVGPTAVTAAGPTTETIVSIGVAIAVGVAVVAIAVAIGAAADVAMIEAAVSVAGRHRPTTHGGVRRAIEIRAAALIPVAVAVALVAPSIGATVYRELITPSTIAISLVERVARSSAWQLAAVAGVWFSTEIVGGLAVRIAILDDVSPARAVVRAPGWIARHPGRTIAAVGLGLAGILAAGIPAAFGAAIARTAVRDLVATGAAGAAIAAAVVLFTATWIVGLAIVAVAAAWRSTLWTSAVDAID